MKGLKNIVIVLEIRKVKKIWVNSKTINEIDLK